MQVRFLPGTHFDSLFDKTQSSLSVNLGGFEKREAQIKKWTKAKKYETIKVKTLL